jgi:hypothetical protein
MATMTRQSLSDSQRLAIRRYFHSHQRGSVDHRAVIAWFQSEHKQRMVQSQVSKILGPNYAHLDDVSSRGPLASNRKRQ